MLEVQIHQPCCTSHQADFPFMERLFADAGNAETDSLSVWHGNFGLFFCCFQVSVFSCGEVTEHPAFSPHVYKYCLETFPDWGDTGILESRLPIRSRPSSLSSLLHLFFVSLSLPVSAILALFITSQLCLSLHFVSVFLKPFTPSIWLMSSFNHLYTLFSFWSLLYKGKPHTETHTHTNVNDVLLINRIWMKKKKDILISRFYQHSWCQVLW